MNSLTSPLKSEKSFQSNPMAPTKAAIIASKLGEPFKRSMRSNTAIAMKIQNRISSFFTLNHREAKLLSELSLLL